MLATWLYLSISKLPDRGQFPAIESIVGISRSRNAGLRVTGALMFSGSRFAQYIEGPPDNVAILRAAIEADARHQRVATLEAATADTRQFAGWSLAYAGSATFVDLELQRIDAQRDQDAASAARSLKLMLAEFSRTDGAKGFQGIAMPSARQIRRNS